MSVLQYNLRYGTSRALITGINNYEKASPLGYAVSDATALAELLVQKFGFAAADVLLLLNEEATKAKILVEYLKWANNGTSPDDRLIFFFAGQKVKG